ncbi:MAG: hypothetical protein ABSH20_13650, partial [Tepidisphaeraceae bacterium]
MSRPLFVRRGRGHSPGRQGRAGVPTPRAGSPCRQVQPAGRVARGHALGLSGGGGVEVFEGVEGVSGWVGGGLG